MRWLLVVLLMHSSAVAKPYSVAQISPEVRCKAWLLSDEARGESLKAQRGVLDVVLHRMHVRKLTACKVLQEHHQFSGYRQGMSLVISKEALQNYEIVRKMKPVVKNSEFFHSGRVPKWAYKMRRVAVLGKLKFYCVV